LKCIDPLPVGGVDKLTYGDLVLLCPPRIQGACGGVIRLGTAEGANAFQGALRGFRRSFRSVAILYALDQLVPRYLDVVDRGKLVYPACKRTLTDVDGNVRAIWEHTRIEAIRYIMMVPRREFDLLTSPARQIEMLDAFLRQQPHEETVVDFTGTPISDLAIGIFAGLNWVNHCAFLAGVHSANFSGTLRNFTCSKKFRSWLEVRRLVR
jgi:hypothetical protein